MCKEAEEKLTAYVTYDGGLLAVSKPSVASLEPIEKRRPDNIQSSIANMLITCMANPFEYWVTIAFDTLNDIEAYRHWRENHTRLLRYVEIAVQTKGRIPFERPNDKRWHIHALMSGIPVQELKVKPVKKPLDTKRKYSEPKQKYSWWPVDNYFYGYITDVQRIGDPTWLDTKIEQPGKAIYMVRQFENPQSSMFSSNRRLFNRSHNLETSLPIIDSRSIPHSECVYKFQNYHTFPFGCLTVDYLHCAYAPHLMEAERLLFKDYSHWAVGTLLPPGAPF